MVCVGVVDEWLSVVIEFGTLNKHVVDGVPWMCRAVLTLGGRGWKVVKYVSMCYECVAHPQSGKDTFFLSVVLRGRVKMSIFWFDLMHMEVI